jgi:MFS family permease
VLAFGFLMSVVTYLDRVCISAAAPGMMADLRLTDFQMGLVFSAFALAYGIFEVPMGWLGDRIGQRKMLTRIVACWSVFTSLTGAVRGFAALVAVRFIFGAAEAGAFPNLARALARWFPAGARGTVNGAMWMGARLGGAVAPAIAVALIMRIGWRATFVVFGAVGLVWCVAFWRWFRDEPAEHRSVNAAELALIRGGEAPRAMPAARPWKPMLTSGNVWMLFGMYFSASFGFYFLVTWLPTYLVREHGLTLTRSGIYAALPLGAAAAACLAGGSISDWLVRRTGSLRRGRAVVGLGGFLLGAAGFAAASAAHGPLAAVLCLTFAQAALDLTVGVSWATCIEIGGPFGGTLAGFMNMASSLAAVLLPVVAAALEQRFGTFHAVFALASAIYFAGGLLWLKIDPTRPLIPETK